MKSKDRITELLDKDNPESFMTHMGCSECGKHYEAIRKHQARNHDR